MDSNYTLLKRPVRFSMLAALIALIALIMTPVESVYAGAYVSGTTTLDPAQAINSGGVVSITPTFNNAQFTNKVLVNTVNNNPIVTPSTNDPVSTVSGNNYHDETDFQIRGRNGLNYAFTRTYNSAPSATSLDSGLGFGWAHSYGMRLVSNDFGQYPNATVAANSDGITSSITYTDERGGQQNFVVTPSTINTVTTYAVTNPVGGFDTLTLNSAAGQHTLTFRNGVKYTFEVPAGNLAVTPKVSARLKTISNPWGDQLTLNYDSLGRLSTITDNLNIAGRTGLAFSYASLTDTHIQSVSDWSSRKWSFSYVNGELWSTTNPLNFTTNYSYVTGHLLQYVIKPLMRNGLYVYTAFNYYQNGRVLKDRDGLGNAEILDYDLYRMRTRVTDPRGGVREYNYDSNGFMTKLIEPDGAMLLFGSQSDGLRYQKFDGLGYATTYSYRSDKSFNTASDNGGNVSREQDALNQTIDTSYGIYDQVTAIKDKRGNNRSFVYAAATTATPTLCGDVQGKLKETHADVNGQLNSLLTSNSYDQFGNPCVNRDYIQAGNAGHFRETLWGFDSNNLYPAYKIVNQSDNTLLPYKYIIYGYDFLGRKLSESVAVADTSVQGSHFEGLSYTYDALDRVIKVTDVLGTIHETVYDANGQVYQENTWYPGTVARTGCAAPAGGYVVCTEATHQYDNADRRISTTDLLGNITKFAYDPSGNLIRQTDANGHSTTYEYNAMNRRTAVINGNGQRTETKYDLAGNAIAVTNDNGETTTSQYDALGRLTLVTNPLGFQTQYKYDANGNPICLIDANALSLSTDPGHQALNASGCTESRSYDELNRLTQSKDAQNNITAYAYNLYGSRTSVTDANSHVTNYQYDDLGRLTQSTDPLNQIQSFVYDQADNLIQATDRKNQITKYTYDALDRNIQILHLADNSSETFVYDNFGDLIQSQNSAITYAYSYTGKHQLQSKTDSHLNKSNKTLSWTYDPAGNIHTKTDYQGDVTTYQYDNANRLVAETNPAYLEVSYHYDDAGRLLDRILSNGAKTHYSWDTGGRLTQLANTTVTGLAVNNTVYSRDRLGNILTQTESTGTSQTAGTSAFSYDPEYRLLKATYPTTANNETISYDPVGNRKTYTKGSQTLYYNVNAANRLIDTRTVSAIGPVYESYSYDANGSMTAISGNRSQTITWDAHNRVKQINTATYQYDPSGYRIQKNAGSSRNYYLQAEHLEAVYDNNNVLLGQFFRGSVIDEVVNAYMPDSTGKLINYTYHHDALESVLGQSGHDGNILASQGYTAFGSTVNFTGNSNNTLQFTGREQDTETGFYNYRARYYDPITGLFISEDPKGFEAGVNFYVYANNNPINANDPTGNNPSFYVRTGLGAIGAVASGLGYVVGLNTTPDQQFSLTNLKIAAGVGFVSGFSAPQTLPRAILTGALSNDAQYAITQAVNNQDITSSGIITNSITGAIGGYLGGSIKIPGQIPFSRNSPSYSPATAQSLNNGDYLAANVGFNNFFRNVVGSTFSNSDFSSVIGNANASAANGGFVLYPNKSNTNQMMSVYKK